MIPDASELARRRLTAQTVIRLMALLPIIAALAPLGFAVGMIADMAASRYTVFSIEELVPFGVVAAFLCVAAWAQYLMSGRLARVLVPVYQRPRCPACGYEVEGLAEPRCPECNAALTPEFMGQPPEGPGRTPAGGSRGAYRASDIIGFFTPLVRLIGLGIALIFVTASASLAAIGVYEGLEWGFDSTSVMPLLALAAFFGLISLVGVVVALFGQRVARWMVPTRLLLEAGARGAGGDDRGSAELAGTGD